MQDGNKDGNTDGCDDCNRASCTTAAAKQGQPIVPVIWGCAAAAALLMLCCKPPCLRVDQNSVLRSRSRVRVFVAAPGLAMSSSTLRSGLRSVSKGTAAAEAQLLFFQLYSR